MYTNLFAMWTVIWLMYLNFTASFFIYAQITVIDAQQFFGFWIWNINGTVVRAVTVIDGS